MSEAEQKKKREYTQAQNKATQKYIKNNYDEIKLRLPKGRKEDLKDHAAANGESLNKFIERAIDEAVERDNRTE